MIMISTLFSRFDLQIAKILAENFERLKGIDNDLKTPDFNREFNDKSHEILGNLSKELDIVNADVGGVWVKADYLRETAKVLRTKPLMPKICNDICESKM
jgi:hypothetical protein